MSTAAQVSAPVDDLESLTEDQLCELIRKREQAADAVFQLGIRAHFRQMFEKYSKPKRR